MITQFDVRTTQGTLLTVPLGDTSSGIVVKDIGGLDPVKATIVSSSFAGQDGEQYQSSRREARNITMKLGMEPDWVVDNVSTLRRRLQSFLMPKSQVNLRFYTDDGLSVDIDGVVETFESPLFTDSPTADISVMCFDSDFVSSSSTETSGSTVSSTADGVIEYEGSIEAGFKFELNVDRDMSEFTIYNRPPDNLVRILDFSYPLHSGDVVTISTVNGDKYVNLTRAGTTKSILYAMISGSSWVNFYPGNNFFRVYATGAAVPYNITYTALYGSL